MKIVPLQEQVLLRPVKDDPAPGGLVLPESMRLDSDLAEVVAISPLVVNADLAVGDRVFLRRFAGTEIEWEGEKLRFVGAGDLLAKRVQADAIPGAED